MKIASECRTPLDQFFFSLTNLNGGDKKTKRWKKAFLIARFGTEYEAIRNEENSLDCNFDPNVSFRLLVFFLSLWNCKAESSKLSTITWLKRWNSSGKWFLQVRTYLHIVRWDVVRNQLREEAVDEGREREKERDRETDRQRETERQTDMQTEGQTERERC